MNRKALKSQWIVSIAILILLSACSTLPAQPSLTAIPPTPTLLPLATATSVPTLAATLSPTVTLTVKFTEKDCTYDGPRSIPYGKFTVKWIVDDAKHNKTALVLLTLASGKTLADLQACPCSEKSDWINGLWLDEENAFGAELKTARSYVHEYDLTGQANYHGEPLYMFCGNEEGKTSSLGPIEVTK